MDEFNAVETYRRADGSLRLRLSDFERKEFMRNFARENAQESDFEEAQWERHWAWLCRSQGFAR